MSDERDEIVSEAEAEEQNLGVALSRLAQKIVDDALGDDVSLDARIDALKVASQYHFAALKVSVKDDPEAMDNTPKFADFVNRTRSAG